MYLGGIRYHVDAKQQAEKRPFAHVMIPRFTGTRFQLDDSSKTPAIGQYYDQITQDDLRNEPDHRGCDELRQRTAGTAFCSANAPGTCRFWLISYAQQDIPVHVLLGGQTNAQMKSQIAALKAAPGDAPLVICATGKFIGEGFDDARLDTLFLTMPISWQGTLAQYVGRLHRLHDGKQRSPRLSITSTIMPSCWRKCIVSASRDTPASDTALPPISRTQPLSSDIIYDQITFQERFLQDIAQAKESVVIVSPYVTVKRVQ